MSVIWGLSSPHTIPGEYEDPAARNGVDDDQAPSVKWGEEEVPIDKNSEVEAPSKARQSKDLVHPGGNVAEALASDVRSEDLSNEVEDVPEAGPSGEQVPAVVLHDVYGGDPPPELCEYEKLRERNIRERDEAMREAREEIEEAKQDMRDNAPGVKKRAAEEEAGGMRKRKKVEHVVEVRRSGRERKPVNYVDEEEGLDGRSRMRGRNVGGGRSTEFSKSPFRSRGEKATSKLDPPPFLPSSSRTLRPRKPVNYSEVPEPEADSFIWCSSCESEEYNGCEKHVTYFGNNQEFKLVVEKSSVGTKAGEGVVNRGKVIPEGVLFGPYSGKFILAAEYEKLKEARLESGNAWEIRDQFSMETVGYVDPGVNPDPELHWMAKINCPNQTKDQNLVGFQLAGQIYYRVIREIPKARELLVWYGTAYAEEIGIDIATVDKYRGEEDHTEEALRCEYCMTGMKGEKELEEHLGKGEGYMYRCGAKQAKEMLRMAKSGERKAVCKVCGKGFKTKQQLSLHGSTHNKLKAFQCEVEGCSKSYSDGSGLSAHKKRAHEGAYHECPECGKRFGHKSHMTRHHKTVHKEEKPYKCAKCGLQFGRNFSLTLHIKLVHEKIRAFKCKLCEKSFGQAGDRKRHMEIVHSKIRYPCTWQACTHQALTRNHLKNHIRRAHTKEWSLECKPCEDQLDIWWGCIHPGEMDKHRAKKHPMEWEEEQKAYRRDHPFVCKYKKCLNRYKTEVEKDRHQVKMH